MSAPRAELLSDGGWQKSLTAFIAQGSSELQLPVGSADTVGDGPPPAPQYARDVSPHLATHSRSGIDADWSSWGNSVAES